MLTKTALVIGKLRTRTKRMTRQRQHTFIGSFKIAPAHIPNDSSLWHLKSRFDSHKTEQMRYMCILLLAVFEDLPMVR
jgi:hypothetical protein